VLLWRTPGWCRRCGCRRGRFRGGWGEKGGRECARDVGVGDVEKTEFGELKLR